MSWIAVGGVVAAGIGYAGTQKQVKAGEKASKRNAAAHAGAGDYATEVFMRQFGGVGANEDYGQGSATRSYNAAEDFLRMYGKDAKSSLATGYGSASRIARAGNRDINSIIDQTFSSQESVLNDTYGAADSLIAGGYDQGRDTLRAGLNDTLGVIDRSTAEAVSTLEPYATGGAQAFDTFNRTMQGDSSAFDAFRDSTGYNFIQEENARAVQRQHAAGGKGFSGNVMAALQDRSSSIASQSYNDYMGQLMGASQVGLNASGRMGDYISEAGKLSAGYMRDTASSVAGFDAQEGLDRGSLSTSLGGLMAGLLDTKGSRKLGASQNLTSYLSSLATSKGSDMANLETALGSNLSGLRTRKADMETDFLKSTMAANYGVTSSAMAANTSMGQFNAQAQGAQYGAAADLVNAAGAGLKTWQSNNTGTPVNTNNSANSPVGKIYTAAGGQV